MKKAYILFVICLCFGFYGCANIGKIKTINKSDTILKEKVVKAMDVRSKFKVNTRFTYLMAWNGIGVGRIIGESQGIITYKGKEAYVFSITTESNEFLSKIYRVEDTYTSYIDVETMTSLRYEANRKEGAYRKHVVVEYDFDKMEAEYTNLTDGSVKKCKIMDNVQDPVSAICYFMTIPISFGEKVSLIVNLNEKNYKVFGSPEEIKIISIKNMGEYPSFRIRPYIELKNEELKKGKAWIYFSADENRYPLYGVVKIPFGKVTATLNRIENLNEK